jgi:hypothetical protein
MTLSPLSMISAASKASASVGSEMDQPCPGAGRFDHLAPAGGHRGEIEAGVRAAKRADLRDGIRVGADQVVGADAPRMLELAVGDIDHGDLGAVALGHLDRIGPEAAGAEHDRQFARLQGRLAHGAIGGDAGAEQRRGFRDVEAVGNARRPVFPKDGVFREAALGMDARARDVCAVGLVARQALPAIAAGAVDIAHADTVPHLQAGDAFAQFDHTADALVSQRRREIARHGVVAFPEMEIGMAKSADIDLHQDLPPAGLGNRDVADFQGLPGRGHDRCLHRV